MIKGGQSYRKCLGCGIMLNSQIKECPVCMDLTEKIEKIKRRELRNKYEPKKPF